MKNLVIIFSIIGIFFFIDIYQVDERSIDPEVITKTCPPFHKVVEETISKFLIHDSMADDRQRLGIRGVSINDVSYLKNKSDKKVGEELEKKYEWPVKNYRVGYYKSDQFYFVVKALHQKQPTEKGKININTGWSILTVMDKKFNVVGSVSL